MFDSVLLSVCARVTDLQISFWIASAAVSHALTDYILLSMIMTCAELCRVMVSSC